MPYKVECTTDKLFPGDRLYTEAELQEKLRAQREDHLSQLRKLQGTISLSADFINDDDSIEDRYYRSGLREAEAEIGALIAQIDNNGEEG